MKKIIRSIVLLVAFSAGGLLAAQHHQDLTLSESSSDNILIPGLGSLVKNLAGQLLSAGISPKRAKEITESVAEQGKQAIEEQGHVPASTAEAKNALALDEGSSDNILIPGLGSLVKNLAGQLLSAGISPKRAKEITESVAEQGKQAIEEQGNRPAADAAAK